MANNADTTYIFTFQNTSERNDFYNKIKHCKIMFDIVKALNLDENGSYRGWVCFIEKEEDNQIIACFDCAWDWQDDFYNGMCEKYPNIETDFICEEEGCEVFVTTSCDLFECRYRLNDNEDYYEHFLNKKDLLEEVSILTGKHVTNIEEVQEVIKEYNSREDVIKSENYLHFYEFKEL